MKIVNLTIKTIKVATDDSVAIIPSSGVAYINFKNKKNRPFQTEAGNIKSIDTYYCQTLGLPPSQEGVIYVVSYPVAVGNAHRDDLYVVGKEREGVIISLNRIVLKNNKHDNK